MMAVEQLLLRLKDNGIRVTLKQGKLLVHAGKGTFTDELKQQLKDNKDNIVKYLSRNNIDNRSLVVASVRPDKIPLSFSQHRLWFIDHLQGSSAEYNMPLALKVEGQFDVGIAEQALTTIIERHEALRTVFLSDNGEPYQVIKRDYHFAIEQFDLTKFDSEEQRRRAEEIVSGQITKPFDLKIDLMVRAAFVRTSSEDILLFNMHHIASDGWSFGVLIKEFTAIYQAISESSVNPLSPLAIQYSDYAQWQHDYYREELLESKLEYWREQLADIPVVHSLPLDFPRPIQKQIRGELVISRLKPDVFNRLLAFTKESKMTPFMLLHACLSLVFSKYSNSHDIVIGTPVANRTQTELEPLIGFFVNTLVLRVNTEYEKVSQYLEHVKAVHQDAQSNQDLPFDQLVEHCDIPRVANHSPIFQILFSMEVNGAEGVSLPGVNFSPVKGSEELVQFDIDIKVKVTTHGIDIFWKYDTSLFTRESIERFSLHFNNLVASLVNDSSGLLADLDMMDEEETRHLTHQLNETAATYPHDVC
ncbi:condensation domain-containing protein, partial [Alteromonas sp. ASW11-130]|uniref:condensation domain-containing protein n=1 Tax=Alteromonas sp. ASW11-130 TaxID=3015775 RepID=UPI0022429804